MRLLYGNGDFDGGSSDWKFSTFTGGNTNPFNSSSDGSFTNYDGSDNGAKTAGAKWTGSTSVSAGSNARYAYQAIVVSPSLTDRTVKYILEFEYAIKTPEEQAGVSEGGNRIFATVLNGHFDDGADAVASTPIKRFVADEVKGKATIIDFWAAWCGPCRRENPNVVNVYEKYHDKGLEIISISLDGRSNQQDSRQQWLKAIEDDNMNWHHASSLMYFRDPVAELYNINSIPATFVLNEDGIILAKKLRGKALENKISELLD